MLSGQGLVPLLLSRILSHFPEDMVYTPPLHATFPGTFGGATWPTTDQMVANGRRLLLTSGIDYGALMQHLMFFK